MKEKLKITAISLSSALGLTACGGGGAEGGGIDNTVSGTTLSGSTITSGAVTGLGSVFVDGVECETDASRFSLDDGEEGPQDEDGLALGMVVTVTGTVNADGVPGTASHIGFDDEIEGIMNANNVGPDVSGIAVPAIAAGNDVEVAGNYRTGTSVFTATQPDISD